MFLKKLFAKILNIFRQPSHIHVLDIKNFPDVSADRIIKELDIQSQAKLRGEKNLPTAEQKELDEIERKILEKILAARKDAYLSATERLSAYRGRITSLDLTGRITDILNITASAPGKFEAEAQLGRNELYKKRDDLIDHHKAYRRFREENKLYLPPKILSGWQLYSKISVLVAIFFVEVFLNAKFFGLRDAMGYAGGLAQAVTLALINIGVSCLISGVAIRRINDANLITRSIGLCSLLFYILFFVIWNLWVGHFREALSIDNATASLDAVASFKKDPFGLRDFETWILVIQGMFFSVLASVDTYFMFDPHWGYASKKLYLNNAHDDYIETFEFAQKELSDRRDEAINILREASQDLDKRRKEFFDIQSKKEQLKVDYRHFQESLETTSLTVFEVYRGENKRARKSPPPIYFDKPVIISHQDLQTDTDIGAHLEEKYTSAQTRINSQIDAINEMYSSLLKTFQEITDTLEKVDDNESR